jgi:hypothetical protein
MGSRRKREGKGIRHELPMNFTPSAGWLLASGYKIHRLGKPAINE